MTSVLLYKQSEGGNNFESLRPSKTSHDQTICPDVCIPSVKDITSSWWPRKRCTWMTHHGMVVPYTVELPRKAPTNFSSCCLGKAKFFPALSSSYHLTNYHCSVMWNDLVRFLEKKRSTACPYSKSRSTVIRSTFNITKTMSVSLTQH
jgi:hypothetical protein